MKVGLVAIHYPRPEYWGEFIFRVLPAGRSSGRDAGDALRSTAGKAKTTRPLCQPANGSLSRHSRQGLRLHTRRVLILIMTSASVACVCRSQNELGEDGADETGGFSSSRDEHRPLHYAVISR